MNDKLLYILIKIIKKYNTIKNIHFLIIIF